MIRRNRNFFVHNLTKEKDADEIPVMLCEATRQNFSP